MNSFTLRHSGPEAAHRRRRPAAARAGIRLIAATLTAMLLVAGAASPAQASTIGHIGWSSSNNGSCTLSADLPTQAQVSNIWTARAKGGIRCNAYAALSGQTGPRLKVTAMKYNSATGNYVAAFSHTWTATWDSTYDVTTFVRTVQGYMCPGKFSEGYYRSKVTLLDSWSWHDFDGYYTLPANSEAWSASWYLSSVSAACA